MSFRLELYPNASEYRVDTIFDEVDAAINYGLFIPCRDFIIYDGHNARVVHLAKEPEMLELKRANRTLKE